MGHDRHTSKKNRYNNMSGIASDPPDNALLWFNLTKSVTCDRNKRYKKNDQERIYVL